MEIYIVKKGDTVWKIAKKYGVSYKRIIADNGLINPDNLVVGQALLILFPEEVYTVKQGDTLYGIAQQYGVSVMSLVQNNPEVVVNPYIVPGQELSVKFRTEKKRDITINGYAYPFINRNVLLKTLPYLTKLTIFGYGFTEDGELIEINDSPLIELAYKFKVAPVMLLTSLTESGNFSTERASLMLNDEKLQNKVIDNVINVMKEKGYTGLDIDIEFVPADDADAFIAFIDKVSDRLDEEGLSLNVDLAPKTSSTQKGVLYEAHRYNEIGQIADTVLLMTYEWGYTYGPPMAVAPINKVKEVVDYAVTEIPREKILLGIPNYGYDWAVPYRRGITKAESIGNDYAPVLAFSNHSEIMYNNASQSPYFEYTDRNRKRHIVWFEDVRSIKAKYELLTAEDIYGAGYWNIMRSFVPNWSYVNAMFNIRKIV